MILDVVLWLPAKVIGHFLQPVTAMFESLGEKSNQDIDDYFKENPL